LLSAQVKVEIGDRLPSSAFAKSCWKTFCVLTVCGKAKSKKQKTKEIKN